MYAISVQIVYKHEGLKAIYHTSAICFVDTIEKAVECARKFVDTCDRSWRLRDSFSDAVISTATIHVSNTMLKEEGMQIGSTYHETYTRR